MEHVSQNICGFEYVLKDECLLIRFCDIGVEIAWGSLSDLIEDLQEVEKIVKG